MAAQAVKVEIYAGDDLVNNIMLGMKRKILKEAICFCQIQETEKISKILMYVLFRVLKGIYCHGLLPMKMIGATGL